MRRPLSPARATALLLPPLLLLTPGCRADAAGDRADPGSGDGAEGAPASSRGPAETAASGDADGPSRRGAVSVPSAESGEPLLPPRTPTLGATVLDAAAGLDLDAAFAAVARGIAWEPYAGILRGPEATAVAGSGNAADQALLLAELLRRAGYTARLVRGRLDDANAAVLIRGMYPAELPGLDFGPEYGPYDPAADSELLALVRDHLWVEVDQGGGSWLPLDPSFPRAVAGEAYARAQERFADPPDELHQRVRITLREATADGRERELGVVEGRTVDLGFRPITLAVHAVPLTDPAEEGAGSPRGTAGGIAGALGGGGGKPEPEERPVVGVAWRRSGWVAGQPRIFETTAVLQEGRDGFLRREWLQIELTAPGVEPVVIERTLFDAAWAGEKHPDRSAEPVEVRRYGIGVLPGPVRHEQLREAQAWWGERLALDRWGSEGAGFASSGDDSGAAALGRIEEAAGAATAHLLPLAFAAESDSVTRILARGVGVAFAWDRPRVLISSTETRQTAANESAVRLSLDLRYDEVSAYPWPGAPRRAAELALMGRGMQESVLEGEVLSRVSGIPTVITTPLLMAAREEDNELRVIPAGAPEDVHEIAGLPNRCAALVGRAAREGRHVVIPSRPVRIGDRELWGWWEVDSETGSTIGVLEDGEHQSMAGYVVLNDENLAPHRGLVIGAVTGATSTLLLVSGELLRYGIVTKEMLDRIEAMLKTVVCSACPRVGVSGGPAFKLGECVSLDLGEPVKTFCDGFNHGFACAAGAILHALRGQTFEQAASVEFSVGVTFGCETKRSWKIDGTLETETSVSYGGHKIVMPDPGGG